MNIRMKLRRYVADIAMTDEDDVDDDESFVDQGLLDSLGLVEIQEFVESEIGRPLDESEIDVDTLLTVNGIVSWLESHTTATVHRMRSACADSSG